MSLYLNLENLQGPIHIALNLSNDFLIQPSISAFHLSWPNLVRKNSFSGFQPSQY
jgi:hypothetical protein